MSDVEDKQFVLEIEECFKSQTILPKARVQQLLERAQQIFKKEANVVTIEADAVSLFGDIHGNLQDQIRLYREESKDASPNHVMVQLGDTLDRGPNNTESFLYALAWKVANPDRFFFIRGNHETTAMADQYGSKKEIVFKYSTEMFRLFMNCCNTLPIAAVVNNKYWCVHGGIPFFKKVAPTIAKINELDRFVEPAKWTAASHRLMYEILWSDPVENVEKDGNDLFEKSARGSVHHFSVKAAKQFLEKNGLSRIIRGHQLFPGGYRIFKDLSEKAIVISIFSSPNYCGTEKNDASVFRIRPQKADLIKSYPSLTNKRVEIPPGRSLWQFIIPPILKVYSHLARKILENDLDGIGRNGCRMWAGFKNLDDDKTDRLSVKEIVDGMSLAVEELDIFKRLISIYDENQDGKIDFAEWQKLYSDFITNRRETVFRFFDSDNDGKINKSDVRSSMKLMEKHLPPELIKHRVDLAKKCINITTDSGAVSKEEFYDLLVTLGFCRR